HHRRDCGILLTDGDVDADDAGALLVDDGVDRDGGLPGAAIANDQLALSATDRNHGVDRLDAGLQRLLHRLANDDSRRFRLDFAGVLGVDRPCVIERAAEWVDDATDELMSDGDFEHASSTANFVAFLELEIITEDDGADVVFLEIQGEG